MKFCSLFSGSSGNCLFVSQGNTRLLVDAGLSGVRIEKALCSIDELPAGLTGILVTHEHRDHTHGVGVLSRRYDLPIYANPGTWDAMAPDLGKIAGHNVRLFNTGVPFDIGDLEIDSFPTSHDAKEPVSYGIGDGKHTLGIATDTGILTEALAQFLYGRELVVLESNHDAGMLETGPYPYPLKRRIAGEKGHLSNDVAGKAACDLVQSGVKEIVLAHLSQENNLPLLAYQTTEGRLKAEGITVGQDVGLTVAKRHQCGHVYAIE
ncbi:MAG: MBL fold metallo-hydrolase [Eubacteriaceae bacterium]|nr:MBL fold metallo-hydrolase [Eubacteriaceae bacterium]MDD4508725.1 MBL fold metallo-hydrolase [Eubacteriaceae bacterium]